ncbi:MAG: general secretion pathway protein GspE [Bacteroidetes bacterium GWE2_29_8]|nr:MAG: general secretion pathway protein GspE [Bacteroidetes bacterium GWE2_29_8]
MEEIIIGTELLQIISSEQAWHYLILPYNADSDRLYLYCNNKNDYSKYSEEIELLIGKEIILTPIDESIIFKGLTKYYRKDDRKQNKIKDIHEHKPENFLQKLISDAKAIRSSDIHIEIYDEKARIRFRIDGKLIERFVIDKEEYPALINKIKIKANLDISEKRLPQDGRIMFNFADERFDIRVSVLPTMYGEKIVLRLLSDKAEAIEIEKLGFSEIQLNHFIEGIKKVQGLVLISGPTGSGKTTTLYATLKLLNQEHLNILTIEDPIEYTLEGVNQVQLKESIGLSFSSALRTFLRQDPDIIMLGEIRDGETAQMAIRAALTGHLVFSTIHTNSAWGIISRLADMGVPPYLLSGTLNLAVAQRLVRLLCPVCKEYFEGGNDLLPKNIDTKKKLNGHFMSKGCDSCFYTGYKGRRAIYEVIPIDAEFSFAIKSNKVDIKKELDNKNITSLSEQAFDLVESGLTSIEEVYPIISSYNI